MEHWNFLDKTDRAIDIVLRGDPDDVLVQNIVVNIEMCLNFGKFKLWEK